MKNKSSVAIRFPKAFRVSAALLVMALLLPIAALATPPIEGNTVEFADSGQTLGSSSSFEVALGDVDNDGDLDAVIANGGYLSAESNRVYTNDGGSQGGTLGTFTDSGQTLGSSNSWAVKLGDLDGDGDLDAFVANGNGQANRVYTNDGGVQGGTLGTFTNSGQTLGSSASFGVSLGDVDGDGDLDAFVANSGQANRVWTNNGSGTFSDSGQALGSITSRGVMLGDMDGDGDLDAFVVNQGPNRVYTNDGSGTFTDSGQALDSENSYSVALGDVDGDGDLDAFVTGHSGGINHIYANDGSGAFSSVQTLPQSVNVALGDLDSDGDLDAFVAAANPNPVYTNNGSGTFSSIQTLGSSLSWGVALGDVDGDGDLDAFSANVSGQANRVWINATVHRNAPFADSGQSLGSSYGFGVALGDVDGDGDLDAFVANENQANRVWANDGSGMFTDSSQSLGNGSSQSVALGDVDGDGDLDAFVVNVNQANKVWTNNGGIQGGTLGIFSDSGQSLGLSWSNRVALGDVDGDGDLDALVTNSHEPSRLWTNDGGVQGGTLGIFSSGQSLGDSLNVGIALGDVDGDGDLDAFIGNDSQISNWVWTNDGSGIFSDSGQRLGSSSSIDVALGDVDGDGDLDAFVANSYNQANRVWTNNGGIQGGTLGTFSDSGQLLGGSSSVGVVLRDIDDDGDLDAFVGNLDSQANRVWTNDGSGVFTDSAHSLGSSSSVDVALGDVDGDGDLDAFVANYSGQANRVWRNEGGSAQFDVTDTAQGNIADDTEDDVLQVVFTHNGIVVDRTLELFSFNIEVLQDDCATAYDMADAAAIIDDIYVRLDDGNGTFEGTETAVATVDTLSLSGGVQTVTFANDDTDVQVSEGGIDTRTYWISVKTTADASHQDPKDFCLQVDPDARFLVEGKTPDFSVSIQDSEATNTGGVVPTAVKLTSFAAAPVENGIEVTWETASELDNLGFNLYRSTAPEGPFDQLNDTLIPTQNPGQVLGAAYTWLDEEVASGGTYYYLLEDVDIHGVVTPHGPVSAALLSPTAVSLSTIGAYGNIFFALALVFAGGMGLRTLKRRKA